MQGHHVCNNFHSEGPDLPPAGPCSEKNVGALHLEKNWRHFLVITVRVSAVSSVLVIKLETFFAHYSSCSLGVPIISVFWAPFL